jgi:hypothetical protein
VPWAAAELRRLPPGLELGGGTFAAGAQLGVGAHAPVAAMRVVASVRVPCFSEARNLRVHQAVIAPEGGGVTRRGG